MLPPGFFAPGRKKAPRQRFAAAHRCFYSFGASDSGFGVSGFGAPDFGSSGWRFNFDRISPVQNTTTPWRQASDKRIVSSFVGATLLPKKNQLRNHTIKATIRAFRRERRISGFMAFNPPVQTDNIFYIVHCMPAMSFFFVYYIHLFLTRQYFGGKFFKLIHTNRPLFPQQTTVPANNFPGV